MNVFIRYLKEMEKPIENFTLHDSLPYFSGEKNLIGFCNRYRAMQ